MGDLWNFALVSIPAMVVLGLRHALDVDHITAIDNLVRFHNASAKARWVGAGFSTGHMASVLVEMIFIIFIVGSVTRVDDLSFWGGIIGALSLATIGVINIYSMKKWGRTGSAILASKFLNKTGMLGPFGSSFVTGLIFGLGFDTATQISAITLSAIASATGGVQVALILAGFFAMGMIPVDTLDSVVLRSAFSRMFHTRGLRCMSYALSGAAMIVAAITSFKVMTGITIVPDLTGPILAGLIIGCSFAYAFAISKRKKDGQLLHKIMKKDHHDQDFDHLSTNSK
jgi:high-affinity nickel-transport protein